MLTPLVIAMPEADGRGARLAGQADRLRATSSRSPRTRRAGAPTGHPEWGAVQARQDQPELLDQRPVGHHRPVLRGRRQDPRPDPRGPRPARGRRRSTRTIESSVVHYGDTTLTFLNNWYRNDQRGTALTYVSAVAVEEKSVIDYNRGNPDGVLDAGREAPPARACRWWPIYPKEGTLFSDNPFFVLDAPWVTPTAEGRRRGLQRLRPAAGATSSRSSQFGFRPGNPAVAVGAPIIAGQRRRPRPAADHARGARRPPVLARLIDQVGRAAQGRPGAAGHRRVRLDGRGRRGNGETKLDLAKQAAIDALDQFKADDLVGLRIFSTEHQPEARRPTTSTSSPIGPIAATREADQRQDPDAGAHRGHAALHDGPRRPTTTSRRATTRAASTPSCC